MFSLKYPIITNIKLLIIQSTTCLTKPQIFVFAFYLHEDFFFNKHPVLDPKRLPPDSFTCSNNDIDYFILIFNLKVTKL